jgi:amino acid transporter
LFKAKHGDVYGTFFEYLAVTYGPWISWGIGVVASTFIYFLNIRQKSRTYRWQILAAAAISMPLYYAIWRIFSYGVHDHEP